MAKRKFVLPDLSTFQTKLESFFQSRVAQKLKEQQDTRAYMEQAYEYHKKGMSLREISEAAGICHSTISYWIKKIEKEKKPDADTREASKQE